MAFNSEQYLKDYSGFNIYPKIHSNIVEYILCNSDTTDSILDLCCCTGLLGRQLQSNGYTVYGLEGNSEYIEMSKKYNVGVNILNIKIIKNNIHKVCEFISNNNIKILVARRCFPELFGNNIVNGYSFIKQISLAGINTIFIEGRVFSNKSVNRLSRIENEIDLCKFQYSLIQLNKNIAILKLTK